LHLIKSKITVEETIVDGNISKFEDNERYEIRKLAKDQGVKIKIILDGDK